MVVGNDATQQNKRHSKSSLCAGRGGGGGEGAGGLHTFVIAADEMRPHVVVPADAAELGPRGQLSMRAVLRLHGVRHLCRAPAPPAQDSLGGGPPQLPGLGLQSFGLQPFV